MRVYGFVGSKHGVNNEVLRALNRRFPHSLVNALLTGAADGLADKYAEVASYAFHESLRILVDAWLDTGRKAGEEHPWGRVVWTELLQDFVQRNPPYLQIDVDGPYLVLLPHTWDKQKELAVAARDAATAMFLQLLDSSERTRLFRCDGCKRYFMRSRMPKRDMPIYHGSYCKNCKGKGAARRTNSTRILRNGKMIGWAADCWHKWTAREGIRSEWVAERVNEQVVRQPISWGEITGKWVTQNQKEIEVEVERRNHAKG